MPEEVLVKNKTAVVKVPHTSNGSYLDVHQQVDVKKNKSYTVTCEVRCTGKGGILRFAISHEKPRKPLVLNKKVELPGGEWQTITFTFTPKNEFRTDSELFLRIGLGEVDGKVEIRSVSLKEAE